MKRGRKPKAPMLPLMVRITVDSRDGSLDKWIPLSEAKRLFNEGKLAQDGTNGGYCEHSNLNKVFYPLYRALSEVNGPIRNYWNHL